MNCDRVNWCRVDMTPEELRATHHKGCEHYDNIIFVVSIDNGGNSYTDRNIIEALSSLADCEEEDTYTVKMHYMLEREYAALPEFQGF